MKKFIALSLFSLLLLSGCSFFKSDSANNDEQAQFSDEFLWEQWGEKKFIAFFAEMRCAATESEAINDAQRTILKNYDLTEDAYLLQTKRPDWFTEYAKTGLEETVQNVMKDQCPTNSRY